MKPLMCILGCSGSGKTTICNELEKQYGLKQIPSYTTRKPRFEGEKGHTFISEDEFKHLSYEQPFVAYAETTGAKYGVTTAMLENEKYSLYVIDYSGLKYLKEHYKGNRKIISVFVDCPLMQRTDRLENRYKGDTSKVLARLEHDEEEFRNASEVCDFKIFNGDSWLDSCVETIYKIYCKFIFPDWLMNPNSNNKPHIDVPTYDKKIYLSHGYGGKEYNLIDVTKKLKDFVANYPNYLFVSPVNMYNELYNYTGYQQGLNMCLALLYDCDEMWVCDNKFADSKGCKAEIEFCKKNDIPIKVFLDEIFYVDYKNIKVE